MHVSPLFLNFKTDPIENSEYKEVTKVKIVTHCSSSKESKENILKEYLAYKLSNVLTDRSFRVRLLDITYLDTGKKKKNYNSYGFIIEPVEIVAKRNNCVLIEPTIVRGENLVEDDADRSALFQYMISNTDWRFKGGHNTKYMKSLTDITSEVIPIPCDFDFSGFVGASYTFPQSWSTAESIYQRDYLGFCRNSDESFWKNIELFKSNKDQIMKTIADFKYLPENNKKETTKFINGFFTEINDIEDFLRLLKNECRPINF